jgi:hypothetical protein
MAGLVPVIRVFCLLESQDVDARGKPAHGDEEAIPIIQRGS